MTRSKMQEGRGCRHCEDSVNVLKAIDHPVNNVDWDTQGISRQGYQVFRCSMCGAYWGERFQYDSGTGSDDDWFCFGRDVQEVKRHC